MKNIVLAVMCLSAISIQAQNKNVTETGTKTVTTVKDSEGERKMVKSQKTREVQNIEFQNAESNELNKDVKPSEVQVLSTTTVTGPDGTSRTVDIDRSAYYSLGDHRMRLTLDPSGYTVTNPQGQREAIMRRAGNNSYIYSSKDKTAVGYFDNNGNFVLETYDDKADRINTEVYRRTP